MNSGPNKTIRILADPAAVVRAAADETLSSARNAARSQGRFMFFLSGGSTPRSLYHLLASDEPYKSSFPWQATQFFWGDERCVPPSSPDSNYRMASESMLDRVPVSAEQIHRIMAENPDPEAAASEYERTIRQIFRTGASGWPRFDLVLLGMGPDGHTASLFPKTSAINEDKKLVAANWVEKLNTFRITLTAKAINASARVVFLVTGGEKRQALKQVLEGPRMPATYPSQLIQPLDGELVWLIDREASSDLKIPAQ